MRLIVSSCDFYSDCWDIFLTLLRRYWKTAPEVLFISEHSRPPYPVLAYNSCTWSTRVYNALNSLPDDYIYFMLEDMFIRKPVDEKRLARIVGALSSLEPLALVNTEKIYYEPPCPPSPIMNTLALSYSRSGVYVCSSQPSLWKRDVLLDTLKKPLSIWEWELQSVRIIKNQCYINNGEDLINIGYNHQPLETGWGITRGHLTKECQDFLLSENLPLDKLKKFL